MVFASEVKRNSALQPFLARRIGCECYWGTRCRTSVPV